MKTFLTANWQRCQNCLKILSRSEIRVFSVLCNSIYSYSLREVRKINSSHLAGPFRPVAIYLLPTAAEIRIRGLSRMSEPECSRAGWSVIRHSCTTYMASITRQTYPAQDKGLREVGWALEVGMPIKRERERERERESNWVGEINR